VLQHGFFHGYTPVTCGIVLVGALGGLLIAVVIKHADNILKCFATSMAIIVSCVVSIACFNFNLTLSIVAGTVMVNAAVYFYGRASAPAAAGAAAAAAGGKTMTSPRPAVAGNGVFQNRSGAGGGAKVGPEGEEGGGGGDGDGGDGHSDSRFPGGGCQDGDEAVARLLVKSGSAVDGSH
jgi:hypothetical protein